MICGKAMVAAGLTAACIVAVGRPAAWGAIVRGDLTIRPDPEAIGAQGTTTLKVFGQQQGKEANADTLNTISISGVETNTPKPNGLRGSIEVKQKDGKTATYAPTVGLIDQNKAALKKKGDFQEVGSRSGDYQGVAKQELSSDGRRISAFGIELSRVDNPPPGGAAGLAYDPYTIPGGTSYDYGATLNATLQLANSSSAGGVEFYALDSTVFTLDNLDNFLDDGSPFEDTLWTLSLASAGLLGGASDVKVDFKLNPDALNEILLPASYLFALPGYSPGLTNAEIAALVDSAFDSAIASALTYDGGARSVSLTGYSLFPDGTQYRPSGDVVYAEGVNAGLTEVPEPPALWLLAAGVIGMVCARRSARARR